MKHEFKVGEYAEGMPWEILVDEEIFDPKYGIDPCSHVKKVGDKLIIPWVVKAYNEAGYNSTVVCLDCIMEKAEALKQAGR